MCEIVNAVLFILRFGCLWWMLPDQPPARAARSEQVRRFLDEPLFKRLRHRPVLAIVERCRRQTSIGRAAIVDSQTARTCESAGDALLTAPADRRFRSVMPLVDTDARCSRSSGQRRFRTVTAAVRLPAPRVPAYSFPSASLPIEAPDQPGAGRDRGPRSGQIGFAAHPRRWVVHGSFSRLSRNRRPWMDAETMVASSTAFLHGAAESVLTPHIASAD